MQKAGEEVNILILSFWKRNDELGCIKEIFRGQDGIM